MEVDNYIVTASAVMALAGFYVPGFNVWYEKQASDKKQLIMLAAIFLAVAGRFALGCLGRDAAFACTPGGAYDALAQFILALAVNAGVYKATNYLRLKNFKAATDRFLG